MAAGERAADRGDRHQREDDDLDLAAAVLAEIGLDARLAGNADIAPPLSAVNPEEPRPDRL